MSKAKLQSAKFAVEQSTPEPQPSAPAKSPLLRIAALLIVAGAGFAAFRFYQQDDLIAAGAIMLVALGALNGFRRGLIGMVVSLMAFGVAYHFAPQFGIVFASKITERFGTTGLLNRGVAIATAGIATFLAFNLFSSAVLWILLGKQNHTLSLNRLLGFVTGGLQSAFAVLLFLGGYLVLAPPTPERGAPLAAVKFDEQVNSTRLRPLVEQYNPFVHIPQLNHFEQVKQTAQVLTDPRQVKRILMHPSIKELQESPETKEAMLGLIRDPEISKLLKSRGSLDPQAVQTVLQNEAILNLLDQPQFLERAQEVISEL